MCVVERWVGPSRKFCAAAIFLNIIFGNFSGDKVWHKQLNTTMTTNSSTPPIEPEEMDEGHGESMASENPLRRKFQELSREKQFGLITLAALGTAMLVTGEYYDYNRQI